jgi:hypothetical protein
MLPTNPLLNATAPAGPHLPVALLRQYAAGTLAPAAQHRVEAHTLACPRCADILAGLLQTPAATTDQALAQLQQRLRQRVQQAAPARQTAAPRRHRWLAPQLAAAAALILGLVAGGWWAWQQRQHTPAVASAASSALPRRPATRATTPQSLPAAPAISSDTLRGRAETSGTASNKWKGAAGSRAMAANAVGTPRRHVARPHPAAAHAPTAPAALPAPAVASQAAPAAGTPPDTAAPIMARTAPATSPPVAAAPAPAARLRATMPPPPALPATPSGGYSALRAYLKKAAAEFEPESKDGPRRSGRVLVRLHIGADGKLEQAEAVRKLRPDYDAEAIRLLQEGPAWVPGITAGRRAAQVIDVPVVFEEPGL